MNTNLNTNNLDMDTNLDTNNLDTNMDTNIDIDRVESDEEPAIPGTEH